MHQSSFVTTHKTPSPPPHSLPSCVSMHTCMCLICKCLYWCARARASAHARVCIRARACTVYNAHEGAGSCACRPYHAVNAQEVLLGCMLHTVGSIAVRVQPHCVAQHQHAAIVLGNVQLHTHHQKRVASYPHHTGRPNKWQNP